MTKPHRQRYGLGSFIKKAARKVKKVFKSPIGKLAALGAGAYFAPMMWGQGAGFGGWGKGIGALRNKMFGAGLGTMRGAGPLHAVTGGAKGKGLWGGLKKFGLGKAAFLGAGAAGVAAPFLMGGEDEDEVIDDWSVTPSSISKIRQMARDRDPSLAFLPPAESVMSGYYGSKDGGIVGLANGGNPAEAQAEQMLRMEYQKYRNQGGTMSYQQFKMAVLQQAQGQGPMAQGQPQMAQPQMAAYGGRAGYQGGELVEDASMVEATPAGMMEENVEEVQGEPTREQLEALAMEIFQLRLEELDEEQLMVVYQAAMEQQPEAMAMQEDIQFDPQMAQPQMAAEGGLMSLGGMEKDYRQEGGFVPLGGEEKADDVPARLSKNEFVFTADAVRAAGGGDIDQGAEVMENVMNNLESGGEISEESQGGGEEEIISEEEIAAGPDGAQEMYDQQQMLQSRMV
jgi:hypothetical protein